MKNTINFPEIEKKLGYEFKNKDLLLQALTRRSYTVENGGEDNEILEFIGDSIVGMMVVKFISGYYRNRFQLAEEERKAYEMLNLKYDERQFFVSELDEAELSELKISLVKRSTLAAATDRCGFHEYLIMGKSDVTGGVQNEDSVKEDLFEALIGAVALDSGWNMPLLEKTVLGLIEVERLLEEGFPDDPDYEAELEAWFASHGKSLQFEPYPVMRGGFKYGACVDLGVDMLGFLAVGFGSTERGASRMAAKRAVTFIGKTRDISEKVIEAVGDPDPERAINQLQELFQKGIIEKPEYYFRQASNMESGNPAWSCSCRIARVYENPEGACYTSETKAKAKKAAAFDAMCCLTGTYVEWIFREKGTVVKKEDCNDVE